MTGTDDVVELRQEIERLRAELAARQQPEAARRRRSAGGWLRAGSYAVLLALVAVLTPVSVVARWVDGEVSSTDRFVALVTPLASDPAVQAAVTDRVSTAILDQIDIPALVDQAATALSDSGVVDPQVMERIRSLAAPLSGAVEGFVHGQVEKVVASDTFASAWERAVRAAHPQAIAVLTGEGSDLLDVSRGTVSVNLAPVIEQVKDLLVEQGFGIAAQIPQVDISFVVFSSDGLVDAQRGFALLDKAGLVLPLLTLAALAAVIAVAPHRRRRRAAMSGALAMALGLLVLALAVSIARQLYLEAIPDGMSAPAAAAVYDTVVGAFQPVLHSMLLLALLAALVLWLSGGGPAARGLRKAVDALRALRQRHLSTGTVGDALWNARLPIHVGVLAVAVLVLVLAEPITVGLLVAVAVSAAVVMLVAEVLATRPGPDEAVPVSSDEPGAVSPDEPGAVPPDEPVPVLPDEAVPVPQAPSPPVSTDD